LLSGFPTKICLHFSFPPYVTHVMPISPSFHSHNFWWEVQIMKFFLCLFLKSTATFPLSDENIFLSTLFSNTRSLNSSVNLRDQVSHSCDTKGNFNYTFLKPTKCINVFITQYNTIQYNTNCRINKKCAFCLFKKYVIE
jgi:hypothetical protein